MEKIEKLISETHEKNFQKKSKEIKDLIINGEVLREIYSQIKEGLNSLDAQCVFVRSSAVSEDSLKASFAGLHDSFLNIKSELPQF